jgi:predicted O-methyltransferase YrrM
MIGNLRKEEIPEELSLDQSWCLGEKTFSLLLKDLQSFSVENLVEFGSGISSARFALELPHVRILSIDCALTYHGRTIQLLNRFVTGHRVTVELRELCWQRHGLGLYQSYRVGQFLPRVDAIIIDGPPGWTGRGREACLYQSFDSLRVGGRVFLDDYERPDEQQIVRNWQAAYPGVFRIRVLDTSPSQLCVLEKMRDVPHARLSFSVAWDNQTYHITRKALALRDLVRRRRE